MKNKIKFKGTTPESYDGASAIRNWMHIDERGNFDFMAHVKNNHFLEIQTVCDSAKASGWALKSQ